MRVTMATEDYLEAILSLGGDTHGVKSVDIAARLNVSKPAVTLAANGLVADGYIEKSSYGTLRLTEQGRTLAAKVLEKHMFIRAFLLLIGVDAQAAEAECCRMEHSLSDGTLEKMRAYLNSIGIKL